MMLVACLSWSCSDDQTSPLGPQIYGTWLGSIDAGPTPLRIVFNLEYSPMRGVEGTVDSPDQGSFGTPITQAEIVGSTVTIAVKSLRLTFVGELAEDEQTIDGELEQAGERIALKLTKQRGPLNYRRPQDPLPPFPYQSAEVTVPSEDASVTLAGTLVWPDGDGPFTAVALITGSGPQNRDEELVNHRPFAVLADALVRQNIAVLRYDDRGFGKSTGNFAAATTESFAADARGAVRFLLSQDKFQAGTVGLIGHSEGGLVGPLAAEVSPDVGFLVLLAGTGVDGKTTLLSQSRAISAAEGASAEELDAGEAQLNELYSCFGDPQDELETLDACLRDLLVEAGLEGAELSSTLDQLETPWMRFFVTYDPKPVLERTTIPVLALHGSLDLQVLADLNAPVIEGALKEAGNEQASVQTLPGLNHLFQHAVTGLPREYGTIDETMSPEVLTLIPEWIHGVAPDAP
jgi:pimeloyl-ACP methyl ester carboxylesterase